jgi:putative transcriptional regulator
VAIVRRNSADMDDAEVARLLAEYRARPQPTEEQIEAWAIEDDSVLTDEDLARMRPVYPPPKPDELRALRARLALSQKQFADRFGFTVDAIQQYEQGRRRPSGPAATLLQVIAAEPDAVARALERYRARWHQAAEQPIQAE